MYKIIIAGGRDFDNYLLLRDNLNSLLRSKLPSVQIVSGMAKGVDTLAIQYAKEYNLSLKLFPANWDKYGKSAGYKRNIEMANYADALVAFWDSKSKGTAHMISTANIKQLAVQIIYY